MSKMATTMDLDDAQKEERLSAWRKLARALVRALRQLWAMVFGGAVDDVRGDLATARRAAGKAADVGGQALVGVGKGIDLGLRTAHGAASIVGTIGGALLPRAPVGPADVEAAASARDNNLAMANAGLRDAVRAELSAPVPFVLPEPAARPALSPTETVSLIRDAIAKMQAGDFAAQDALARLPHRLEKWVLMLDEASADRLVKLPTGDLYRHVSGVADAPGVPPLSATAPSARFTSEDLAEIVRRSMRTMKSNEAEIARMSDRPGSAPRPRLVTEPLYDDEAEASFRSAPRAGRAY